MPGHSQRKDLSPGPVECYSQRDHSLKYVKGASCVTQLSYVPSVASVKNVASKLPVGARLQNFWQVWLDLGAGPKVIQILKEGYTLPFRNRPRLTRHPTVVSCYANPHRNSYLLEALHQLIDKNAVELVLKQTSLGFFNRLFFGSQAQQQMEANIGPKPIKSFPQSGEIQDGNTGNHQNIPPTRGMGHLGRFQRCLLPYPNTGTVQEISQVSCPGSDIPIQSLTFRSVHSTHGVHCINKGGEADGRSQGYKNPPVPRRLVSTGQIIPYLPPTYSKSGGNVSSTRMAGEHRKIGAGAEASFQFCRLPVRPQVRPGPTDPGPVAKPSGQDTSTSVITGLSGPTIHVPDRPTNSHRETSSPRPTAHETPTVASQKQLESARISREDYPPTENPAPSLTMVARRRQCASRSTITPSKTCSADIYRRIKRRVGRSLKRVHCKGVLVSAGKQAAHKLSGTKSSPPGLKRVPKPMHKQHCPGGHGQYYGSGLYKQGRGNEVGPAVCSTVENLDLVFPATSDLKSPTYPWPTKCDSRQAIQAKPDHPNRMVPPSGHFPRLVQKMAPASDRPICHEVQQQVTSVCVSSAGHSGSSSGRTHPAMGGSRCITPSHRPPYWAKWWRSCKTPRARD